MSAESLSQLFVYLIVVLMCFGILIGAFFMFFVPSEDGEEE